MFLNFRNCNTRFRHLTNSIFAKGSDHIKVRSSALD